MPLKKARFGYRGGKGKGKGGRYDDRGYRDDDRGYGPRSDWGYDRYNDWGGTKEAPPGTMEDERTDGAQALGDHLRPTRGTYHGTTIALSLTN